MSEWRSVTDPPALGEVVLVKDDDNTGWEDRATLLTAQSLWVSEVTGHIVFPTHWKAME